MGDNDWVAYCFDEAVVEFGTRLDNALEEVSQEAKTVAEAQRKQSLILASWLNKGDPKAQAKHFANPVATKVKKG